MSKRPKLSARQRAFVAEYLKDLHATGAYKRAGFKVKDDHVAGSCAARLLADARIRALVTEGMKAREKRTEITQDKVLRELAKIGFANMLDYVTVQDDGSAYVDFTKVHPVNKAPKRSKFAAIGELTSEVYVEGSGEFARDVKRVKLKLHDKRAALVDIGKHLGMWSTAKAASASFVGPGPDGKPQTFTLRITDDDAPAGEDS